MDMICSRILLWFIMKKHILFPTRVLYLSKIVPLKQILCKMKWSTVWISSQKTANYAFSLWVIKVLFTGELLEILTPWLFCCWVPNLCCSQLVQNLFHCLQYRKLTFMSQNRNNFYKRIFKQKIKILSSIHILTLQFI